jgi:G3E family GTPase
LIPTRVIPTLLINGWRGSGKTGFIHQLLQRAAIRQNPRDTALHWCVMRDAPLLPSTSTLPFESAAAGGASTRVEWIDVAGGCLCCSALLPLRVKLVSTLRRLQQLPPALQPVLLLETSGLADPRVLLRLLGEPGIASSVALRACMTVLAPTQLQSPAIVTHPMFLAQCRAADRLLWLGSGEVSLQLLDRILEAVVTC